MSRPARRWRRLRRRWVWEPELGDHIRSIWAARWFVLLGSLAVAGVVFAWRSSMPDRYEATGQLRLIVLADGDTSLDEGRLTLASRIYAELAESTPVIEAALARSGTGLTIDDDAWAIEVTRSSPPGFLEVDGRAESPDEAADLAASMLTVLVETVDDDRLGPSAAGANGLTIVPEVVERPEVPTGPSSPQPSREAGIALTATLILLAGGSVGLRAASGRLPLDRPAERVQELFGLPTVELTGTPEDRTRLALFASRRLRRATATVVIQCGGWPNPAAALRLAEAMSGDGRRALVVDGDPTSPTLDAKFGVGRSPGLAEVLSGTSTLQEAVHPLGDSGNLSLLTVGRGDGQRLSSDLTRFLGSARSSGRFDAIVVSLTSAAMPDGAAAGLEIGLDRPVVLVVDPTRTSRRQLGELLHAFGGSDEIGGLVLLTNETATIEIRRLANRWSQRAVDGHKPPLLSSLLSRSGRP